MTVTYWNALVTTALLGTARRPPPDPPPGPIADAVADLALVRGDQSADVRLLNQVAVSMLARRAAARPQRPVAPLAPPPADDRPLCPPAAVAAWRRVVAEWPVLEDEWLALAWQHGVALPGDVVVDLLERHRRDPVRSSIVATVGGDMVPWLREHVPSVGRAPTPSVDADPAALPTVPIGPPLDSLVAADGATVAGTLRGGLTSGQFTAMHRPVLVNLLARCRTIALDDIVDALSPIADTDGVAASLVDLARCRADMLASFAEPAPGDPSP